MVLSTLVLLPLGFGVRPRATPFVVSPTHTDFGRAGAPPEAFLEMAHRTRIQGRPRGSPSERPGGGWQAAALRTTRVRMATARPAALGGRLAVRVVIDNASDVASVPFHVRYDPAVLAFNHGEEGAFLRRGGRDTAFLVAETARNDEVVVGLSRLGGGGGTSGQGELCTLYFSVVGVGDAGLGFEKASVRDAENRIVPSDFEAAVVVVR